jgi:hypothetical protein
MNPFLPDGLYTANVYQTVDAINPLLGSYQKLILEPCAFNGKQVIIKGDNLIIEGMTVSMSEKGFVPSFWLRGKVGDLTILFTVVKLDTVNSPGFGIGGSE